MTIHKRRIICCLVCNQVAPNTAGGRCNICYQHAYNLTTGPSGYTRIKEDYTKRHHGIDAARYTALVAQPCTLCATTRRIRELWAGDVLCRSCHRSLDAYLRAGRVSYCTKSQAWWDEALAYLATKDMPPGGGSSKDMVVSGQRPISDDHSL